MTARSRSIRSLTARVVGAAALIAGTLVASPTGAQAANNGTEVRSQQTGRCLDDSTAFGVRTFGCNRLNFQSWAVRGEPQNSQLRNYNTGRCLDDSQFGLRPWPCNGMDYQNWTQTFVPPGPNSPGGTIFRNHHTGRCLDDSQFGLRSWPCNGMRYQLWDLNSYNPT